MCRSYWLIYLRQRYTRDKEPRASVSISTCSIAPDSASYRHTSSRRQLGAEFVIQAVLHIHHCYPITRGVATAEATLKAHRLRAASEGPLMFRRTLVDVHAVAGCSTDAASSSILNNQCTKFHEVKYLSQVQQIIFCFNRQTGTRPNASTSFVVMPTIALFLAPAQYLSVPFLASWE